MQTKQALKANGSAHRAGQKRAYRQNLHENYLYISSLEQNLIFSAFCIVTCARREVTLLSMHMVCSVRYSLPLFIIMYSWRVCVCVCVCVQLGVCVSGYLYTVVGK